MSQSLSQLYVHIIYHTKGDNRIYPTDKNELCAYIAGVISKTGSIPICINGMPDHIHVLCILSKNMALAEFVRTIKTASSKWMKDLKPYYRNFEWQKGYAGFSVSQSVREATATYIKNQEEHHKQRTFQEEYIVFLKEYGIEYDEKYLWTD
ncbi:transposase [Bacteroides sp. 214]|uniref:transposase n=1 Tax=Bacteroides sp. 214 TaxID=2302935 RepID=UPI0013D77940|nr:transposase [Bacteroides sp. 214]NDW13413.1 transposase [Bacteroides sp. 214]